MKGLLLQDVREEIVSLLDQSTVEFQSGSSQVAVSMLMEAQFLLGDIIQNELNRIQGMPPLVPSADDCAEVTNAVVQPHEPASTVSAPRFYSIL
jgi:hypothetical protein